MICIFCEKPDAARHFTKIVGAEQKKNGWYEGNNYKVTWGFGHLVSLENASAYTENPWDLVSLPIFPEPFKLKVETNKAAQFNTVKKLFKEADMIINAGDAGREGELIFRYIHTMSGCNGTPVKRLWISSLTDSAIRKGLENLKEASVYDPLYYSGRARNRADWIVGINGTIAMTKLLNSPKPLSLGRVQTPTFGEICKRWLENKAFLPRLYKQPEITLNKAGADFTVKYEQAVFDELECSELLKRTGELVCTESRSEEKTEKPPLLFDLTLLQRTAFKEFSFSAQKTLDIAQSLYEKKTISYPRTSSMYLSGDVYRELPELFSAFKRHPAYSDSLKFPNLSPLPMTAVNDKKITDHHAIIPTGFFSEEMTEDETSLFNLIVKRFFAAFSSDCIKTVSRLVFETGAGDRFIISGSTVIKAGWRSFFPEKEAVSIPKIEKGETFKAGKVRNPDRYTKAPALYNDDTILWFMDTCGKEFDAEDLPKSIKDSGIGTPATRAQILERIISVGYIVRDKSGLIPTGQGLKLYGLIKDFSICDVNLTGKWESLLNQIEENRCTEKEFLEGIKTYFSGTLLKELFGIEDRNVVETYRCPKCQNQSVTDKGKLWSCDRKECGFKLFKTLYGKTLTKEQFIDLTALKQVPMKNLKGKSGKPFSASLILDPDNAFVIKLSFEERGKKKPSDLSCPKCQKRLLSGRYSYYCEDKTGCGFTVSKTIAGKEISGTVVSVLLKNGRTSVIQGFSSKAGKKFDASLMLDPDYKIKFAFETKS